MTYPSVLNIPQHSTEQVLTERLTELGGRIERSLEVIDVEQDEDGVTATIGDRATGTHEIVRTQYVVACDGAHSRVRKLLGLSLDGHTYADAFLVTDVLMDWQYATDAAHIFLHSDGFLMISRFKPDQLWHIVTNLTPEQDRAMQQPTLDDVRSIFRARTGDTATVLHDPLWISKFRVHYRHVRRYRVDRVFLAGDAAHLHSPMAGNGLGNSMQDGYNLGWKLALVLRGQAKPAILDTYERERRPTAAGVLRTGHMMHRILATPRGPYRLVRDVALPLVLRAVRWLGSNRSANSFATPVYRESPLSRDESGDGNDKLWQAAPHAGDRLVHGAPIFDHAGPTNLLEVTRGPTFHLLLFAGSDQPAHLRQFAEVAALARAWLGATIQPVLVVPHDQTRVLPTFAGKILYDPSGVMHRSHGARGPALYLVRPDGYIAYRANSALLAGLQSYLTEWFYPAAHASLSSMDETSVPGLEVARV